MGLGSVVVIAVLIDCPDTVFVDLDHRIARRVKNPRRQHRTHQCFLEHDLGTPCATHIAEPGAGRAGNIDEIAGRHRHGARTV